MSAAAPCSRWSGGSSPHNPLSASAPPSPARSRRPFADAQAGALRAVLRQWASAAGEAAAWRALAASVAERRSASVLAATFAAWRVDAAVRVALADENRQLLAARRAATCLRAWKWRVFQQDVELAVFGRPQRKAQPDDDPD